MTDNDDSHLPAPADDLLMREAERLGAVFKDNDDLIVAAGIDANNRLEQSVANSDPSDRPFVAAVLARRQGAYSVITNLSTAAQSLRDGFTDDCPAERIAAVIERMKASDIQALALAHGERFLAQAERRKEAVFGYDYMWALYGAPAQIALYVFALALADLDNAFTDLPAAFRDDIRTTAAVTAVAAEQSNACVPSVGIYAAAFEQFSHEPTTAAEEMQATITLIDRVVAFDRALTWLVSCGHILVALAQAAASSYSEVRKAFSADLDWLNEQFGDRGPTHT